MILPGQTLTVDFTLRHPTTGAAANADSLPTGKLVRSGTDSAETVTITNKATGIYKASAVIPDSWDPGDIVQLRIAATVGGVADNSVIFGESLGSEASGGAGTGARTVTITVDDGTDPIEGALVRVTHAAESYVLATDASGEAVFALDDATWAVAVTMPLYSFTPTTLVVNGNETQTYSMTAVSLPAPAEGLQTTAYATIYDGNGEPLAGETVSFQVQRSSQTAGRGYDSTKIEATSDESGLLSVTLLKSTRYRLTYGLRATEFTTSTADTFPLAEFIGVP